MFEEKAVPIKRLISRPMGEPIEDEPSLYEIYYIAANRAKTPIFVACNMHKVWAEHFVLIHNTNLGLVR